MSSKKPASPPAPKVPLPERGQNGKKQYDDGNCGRQTITRKPLTTLLETDSKPVEKLTAADEKRLDYLYDLYIKGIQPRFWKARLKEDGHKWSVTQTERLFDIFWASWLARKAEETFPGNRQYALAAAIERGLHIYNKCESKDDIGGMLAAAKWVADLQGVGLKAQIWARRERFEREKEAWRQAHSEEKIDMLRRMSTKQLRNKVVELLSEENLAEMERDKKSGLPLLADGVDNDGSNYKDVEDGEF